MVRTHTLTTALILLIVCTLPANAAAAAPHKHAHHCKHHLCHTNLREPHAARHSAATIGTTSPTVTIASTLAEPCHNTQLTPTSENLQAIRGAIFCLINQERARNNELPLHISQQLQQAAQIHTRQMISQDYFAHITPAGETPLQRVTGAGYLPNRQVGYTIGENIAWGTLGLSTPQTIVAAWIASPGHLTNILESKYQDTGIGVEPAVPASLSGGQPGGIYSQTFGFIIK
jgi:uncharacterized protein YkwD